jgi:hypothetical protein
MVYFVERMGRIGQDNKNAFEYQIFILACHGLFFSSSSYQDHLSRQIESIRCRSSQGEALRPARMPCEFHMDFPIKIVSTTKNACLLTILNDYVAVLLYSHVAIHFQYFIYIYIYINVDFKDGT